MWPLVDVFRYGLQPAPLIASLGLQVSVIDVVAAIRLCAALRQMREESHRQHLARMGAQSVEAKSFVRSLMATLVVVYGGEAITAPFLGYSPSFMVSGTIPLLYTIVQAIVEYLPVIPAASASNELPLAFVDGITRAYLLCNLIPPPVIANVSPSLAHSPWTLLLTSLITANGGFFLVNLFSFLNPTPLTVQTPPEILPYGWTAVDLWCAPVITGYYALLTHAQPFWADFHRLMYELLGEKEYGKNLLPLDPEVARASCALILAALFTGRAINRFGLWETKTNVKSGPESKTKTQ
ncbi:hypothetical protein AX17_001906 [Amanita inopinata Kibby_2008]|nr:hypothetical protein AX17_001906 [Amanita inopinata Kibby_2008]